MMKLISPNNKQVELTRYYNTAKPYSELGGDLGIEIFTSHDGTHYNASGQEIIIQKESFMRFILDVYKEDILSAWGIPLEDLQKYLAKKTAEAL